MPSTDLGTELVARSEAMASRVEIRVPRPSAAAADAVAAAEQVFRDVDRTCTRFDGTSDLMRANAAGDGWLQVGRYCFDAVREAHAAYRRTSGRFDPRILSDLVRLGYAASLRTGRPRAADPAAALAGRAPLDTWQPGFRAQASELRIGSLPVDLGGIGKGLAVRWASAGLRDAGVRDHLVEAGGDMYCAGAPSDAETWRVGIEHPLRGDHVAVLAVRDAAVATSSVRVRHWRVAGVEVHHLVDPATGCPGGAGLASVTVVDDDPARAEVWSKVLFLTGRAGVASTADFYGLSALWVDTEGAARWSPTMRRHVLWAAP